MFEFMTSILSWRKNEDTLKSGGETYERPDDPGFCDIGVITDFGDTWFPRCHFSVRIGGIVTGWPAKGGFLTLFCSLAELEFLGLDRFTTCNKSDDPEDEEAHCARMRQLGAKWFRDVVQEAIFDHKKDPDAPKLFVGWPSDGGVWALYIDTTTFQFKQRMPGRIGNAFTMEERCKMIEKFGGTFYADPGECPHLDLDGSKDQVYESKLVVRWEPCPPSMKNTWPCLD